MEKADCYELAAESCAVAAFAMAGGDIQLAEAALEDAAMVLRLAVPAVLLPQLAAARCGQGGILLALAADRLFASKGKEWQSSPRLRRR